MSFSVRLYEFSKKENSTARPSGTGTEYDCILVRDSGVLQPVIELKMPLTQDPAAYDYAYIPAFERYYFISEWKFQGALWHAHMIVDALATWRGTIGSQSFYVLRSSAQKDGSIMDTMYPVKDTYSISANNADGGAWFNPNSGSWLTNGYFIVGILSYNTYTDAIGGVNYYAMLPGSFNVLMQEMFKEDGQYSNAVKNIFDPISNYSNQQKANLLYVCENPYNDYIKSVTWVPDAPTTGSVQNTIYLGKTQITGVHYLTVNVRQTKQYTSTITIPKHPLTSARGSYTNLKPFTELYLSLPKIGYVEVDPVYFADRSVMRISLDIDPITGDGMYRVYAQQSSDDILGYEIARFYCPIGVSVSIVQGKELGTKAEAMGGFISNALSALSSPGSIASLPAAIANVQRAEKSAGTTIGSNGGWLGLQAAFATPRLIAIHHDIAADDNAQNGRPLCQVKTPASLGGYMMIQDADIQAPATSQELAAIKQYMEAGFYYE